MAGPTISVKEKDETKTSHKPWRRHLFMLQLLLGVVLLAVLLYSVDHKELAAIIRQSHKGWLIFGWFWMLAAFYWRSIVHGWLVSIDTYIPTKRLFEFTLISTFFSNFLPTQVGGDAVKGLYLFPYFKSRANALGSVIVQRILGLTATFLITVLACIAAFLEAGLYNWVIATLIGLIVFAASFVAAITFAAKTMSYHLLYKKVPGWAFAVKGLNAITRYRNHPWVILRVFMVSCLITIHGIITVIIAAKSVGVNLTLLQGALTGGFSQLSAVLAITPGGLGIAEAVFVVLGKVSGVGATQSLGFALVIRVYQIGIGLIGGLIYLKNIKSRT